MSYQIITRITITPDLRVMVRMAANNIRPLDFRYDEVVSLTETLRTKGRPTLELELLSLFFKQKTAYEMESRDWSSDVCSSDLPPAPAAASPSAGGRHIQDRKSVV